MHERMQLHTCPLEKTAKDDIFEDEYILSDEYPNHWAVLVDKGYQGAAEEIRAIVPKKKTIRGFSSREDEIFNRKLSSDRIIVENYFGRLGKLLGILGTKFRWSESLFDTIFAIGIALTNYHVTMHKLRDLDGSWYTRTVTDWYKSGRKKAKTCGSSVKVSC